MKKLLITITLFCSLLGISTNIFTSAPPQDPLNCGTMDCFPLPTHITTRAFTYLGAAIPVLYGAEVLYNIEPTRTTQASGALSVVAGITAVTAVAHMDLKYHKERKEYEHRELQAEATRELQESCRNITRQNNPRPGGIRLPMNTPSAQ